MPISERLSRLGSGVFARNDQRKSAYAAWAASENLTPLLDLSLGSTDLQPPAAAIEAMAAQLAEPASSAYCLHGATLPFRLAVANWAEKSPFCRGSIEKGGHGYFSGSARPRMEAQFAEYLKGRSGIGPGEK